MEGITVGEPPKAPMPPMTEVHIYRDGDMILEVTDGVEQRRFTVVSHILCIASPVFRAMLGRHSSFRERREFEMQDESFLFVLELPEEESVEAMEIMLNAIHLQNDKVPTIISFNKLVQIAVICDKYDMSKAVHPQVSFWMQQNERLALLDNYEDWLFISWVFRRSKTFESLSRKMILHIRGDDSGTWKLATPTRNIQGHIPDSVAEAICRERIRIVDSILKICEDCFQERLCRPPNSPLCKFPNPTVRPACDTMMLGALMRLFHDNSLLPSQKMGIKNESILQLASIIREMENQITDIVRATEEPYGCSYGSDGSTSAPYSSSSAWDYYSCEYHGTEEDCFGPSTHKQCSFLIPLLDDLKKIKDGVSGLKLSEFPSRV